MKPRTLAFRMKLNRPITTLLVIICLSMASPMFLSSCSSGRSYPYQSYSQKNKQQKSKKKYGKPSKNKIMIKENIVIKQ